MRNRDSGFRRSCVEVRREMDGVQRWGRRRSLARGRQAIAVFCTRSHIDVGGRDHVAGLSGRCSEGRVQIERCIDLLGFDGGWTALSFSCAVRCKFGRAVHGSAQLDIFVEALELFVVNRWAARMMIFASGNSLRMPILVLSQIHAPFRPWSRDDHSH